ncbi:hypothetical protein [Planomonospora venezuelensis]|uniref:Polyketide cyclase / dehydrase and lipid transport n=1 Tax=Planomonospora venezuelensis TaxID=1999 RepID=A0A841D0X0_PLAVE|nr:hypothetical protein [Planomonospora venezuelensis]MBB5962038.1 hypothetical protein [Planomonospora venezuelensis]GIN00138.1 hypothetical protein Pve01_17960 [Planomonospora venezuelensis]
MSGKKLITEVAGIVEAPPAAVFDDLAGALLPDGRRTGRFTVEDLPGHTSAVEVAGHTISFQGGWWYRGEWSVEPHSEGALLVHRVFNVAQGTRWGVLLANRFFIGFAGRTRQGFAESLVRTGRRLRCATRLVQ